MVSIKLINAYSVLNKIQIGWRLLTYFYEEKNRSTILGTFQILKVEIWLSSIFLFGKRI